MNIVIKCPNCSSNLKASEKLAGKKLNCPKCSTLLIVPTPQVAQIVEPQLELLDPLESAPLNPLSPAAHPAANRPLRKPAAGKKPAKKTKSKGISWVLIGAIVAPLLLVFGGVLFYVYNASKGTGPSKTVTLNDGREVKLSDFEGKKFVPPPKIVPVKNVYDKGNRKLRDPSNPGSDRLLETAELIRIVEPSIVRIKVVDQHGNEGIGSGFFIDKEGKVVTNYHVIRDASKVTVQTANGETIESVGYVCRDKKKDIAIIQVDPALVTIKPIAIAIDPPEKGEKVAAFGAPQGFGFSQTLGIVSSIRNGEEVRDTLNELNPDYRIYERLGFGTDMDWIQHSAAISGGNSGGPLVNMRGQLVGVNTWTHHGGQNLNFASTTEEVARVFSNRKDTLSKYRQPYGTPVRSSETGQ